MAKDVTIDGYYLNSNGAWSQNLSGNIDNVSTTASQNGSTQIVTFADENLEQAVRYTINKPKGNLYKSDVEKVTVMNVVGKPIKDISGISGIENLTNLF